METAKKIEHPVDRVMEPVMASLIGCSPKSLEHQRYQGLIPRWVWAKRTAESTTTFRGTTNGQKAAHPADRY